MICRCRNCGSRYDENKSRADYKGYCTQACLHEKARKHGYKKRSDKVGYSEYSEYAILNRVGQIGSVEYARGE